MGVDKERKFWAITGVASESRFGVHNNSLVNVQRGLYERVLFRVQGGIATPPVQPLANVFENRLAGFRGLLVRNTKPIRRITRAEFVGLYVGRKRTVYENAAASLAMRPLNKADGFLSTFVKCEKLDFHAKPDPAPRVIQPRSPRYNVELGRFLKLHEHEVFEGIAEVYGGRTVMKGLNAEGQAEALREMWDSFVNPVAVGLDASRFDQHVSSDALLFEHSCYLEMCPPHARRRLDLLLSMQRTNRGYARVNSGLVKYEVSGKRMSGDMNTGLGNCLLMCGLVYGYCNEIGVKHRLANNGDDCVVIMERTELSRFQAGLDLWFRQMGFIMECEEPVSVFEEIEFCQTHPVWDGVRWVMVRDPRVCIDKDCLTVLDMETGLTAWCGAIGECGLSLSGGIPVLQEFYSALLRHGTTSNLLSHPWMDSGFKMLAQGMHRRYQPVSPETRASFWRAFSILPDLQEAIEDVMLNWSISPASAGVSICNPLTYLPQVY